MDREQEEMQFLGVFGIVKEAYKIIISCNKILSQITLSLILPLSLLILIHIEVSDVVFDKIIHNEVNLSETQVGSPKYDKISDLISSEWTFLFLFKLVYFIFLLTFSLLSTSAVVYTIACVYTARDLSFRKVMSVVPKVWKRVMVTFLWTFLAFFIYNVAATIVMLFIFFLFFLFVSYKAGIGLLIVFSVLYVVGFVYLSLIWHLAGVVSVLEEARGIQAMNKSKALMKGKMLTAICIYGVLSLMTFGIQFAFQKLVVHGGVGNVWRVVYGVVCLLASVKLMLFGLVIQTVLYFVCKSYHHENIDKSALSDHLEVYLGEYVPLTAKDVQLEQYHV